MPEAKAEKPTRNGKTGAYKVKSAQAARSTKFVESGATTADRRRLAISIRETQKSRERD